MKKEAKKKAIKLRKEGKTYNEILKEVNVAKSTLSAWLKNVSLSKKQRKRIKDKQQKARIKGANIKKKNRIKRTNKIIEKSKKEAKELINNRLFLIGLMLYWGEGDNSENHERVGFTNSDPKMIKLMMRWFLEVCKIPKNKIKARLYIHELENKKEIEKYWSKITNLPLDQFHQTHVKETSLGHRKNKLYKGTCRIQTYNKDLFRKIKGWRLGTLEILNINL